MSSRVLKQRRYAESAKGKVAAARRNKTDMELDRLCSKVYDDCMVVGLLVARDMFGFGKKRIIRFKNTIWEYIVAASKDENMRGTALVEMLNAKYGVDVKQITKESQQSDLIRLYGKYSKLIPVRSSWQIAQAALYNYLALSMTALKTKFRISRKDIQRFGEKVVDYLNSMADKRYGVTIEEIKATLEAEIGCEIQV